MRRDCPQRQISQDFGTAQSQLAIEQERVQFIPPCPSGGQRNQFQLQGSIRAPPVAQRGQRGQSVGRGQVQSLQARMSRIQGRVYTVVPEAEHADQSDTQGTFLLSYLLTRVAFELDASCSFINASRVIGLGSEVEAFREMIGNSSLGCRVRVG